MSKKETVEARAESLITPVIDSFGLKLVDTEYVKEAGTYYLRYYIDKEGGVTIDDCEKVSRAVSDLLDREDFPEEAYVLEVSSPGIGRPIKKDKDFLRNIGKKVELKLFKPENGVKEHSGTLSAYDAETVTISEDGTEKTFTRKNLSLIREYADFYEIPAKEEEETK